MTDFDLPTGDKMKFGYRTSGVCSESIDVEVKDGKIAEVRFNGGCPGSLTAVSKLVVGMTPRQAIGMLKSIPCGGKPTSCPDQLARALEAYLNSGKPE